MELKGGLIVARDAVKVAIDLSGRGVTLTAKDGVLFAAPASALSPEDRVTITRWKPQLLAITDYIAREGWMPK